MRNKSGNMYLNLADEKTDKTRISDEDPFMAAKKAFDHILEQIRSSNLNFQLQLSTFSASIYLKKSLVKDKIVNPQFPTSQPYQTFVKVQT